MLSWSYLDEEMAYTQSIEDLVLAIHSGTHGDEYEVIDCVTQFLERNEARLPGYMYVPQVSPSAVRKKTRTNEGGNDINRLFMDGVNDREVGWNQHLLSKGPYDLFLSFHEDPEYEEYYVYDVSQDAGLSELILVHNEWLQRQGVALLNGLDDCNDPVLGFEFKNGYRKFERDASVSDDGMITTWALNRNLIRHSLIVEVPGLVDIEMKQLIVDSLFDQVVLRYFGRG